MESDIKDFIHNSKDKAFKFDDDEYVVSVDDLESYLRYHSKLEHQNKKLSNVLEEMESLKIKLNKNK